MTDLFTNASTDDHGASGDDTNPVELLVGEGKKFKSVEDLAKGKLEADRFIQRLQDELQTVRSDLATAKRLEEIVDRLSTGSVQSAIPPVTEDQTNQNGADGKGDTSVNFEELVEKALTKKEQEKRQKDNIEEVSRTLTEAWGPGFVNKLVAEAAALGMSKDEVNALAARNPKALYRLVGVTGESQARGSAPNLFTPPTSNVNTTGFKPSNGERGKSYYDKLKRDNPSLYNTPRIQQQEYKDAMALGDRFFQV